MVRASHCGTLRSRRYASTTRPVENVLGRRPNPCRSKNQGNTYSAHTRLMHTHTCLPKGIVHHTQTVALRAEWRNRAEQMGEIIHTHKGAFATQQAAESHFLPLAHSSLYWLLLSAILAIEAHVFNSHVRTNAGDGSSVQRGA